MSGNLTGVNVLVHPAAARQYLPQGWQRPPGRLAIIACNDGRLNLLLALLTDRLCGANESSSAIRNGGGCLPFVGPYRNLFLQTNWLDLSNASSILLLQELDCPHYRALYANDGVGRTQMAEDLRVHAYQTAHMLTSVLEPHGRPVSIVIGYVELVGQTVTRVVYPELG